MAGFGQQQNFKLGLKPLHYCKTLFRESNVQNWTTIRVVLIAAAFLASAFSGQDQYQSEQIPAVFLLIVLLVGVIGLPFIVGIQRVNPWSAKVWQYPTWSANPFQPREPLQFFHFGGYFMLGAGLGSLLNQLAIGLPLRSSSSMLVVFGAGLLIGVQVCTRLYKSKMARS